MKRRGGVKHKFAVGQHVWIESPVLRDGTRMPREAAVVRQQPTRAGGKYSVQDRSFLRFIPEHLLSAREAS